MVSKPIPDYAVVPDLHAAVFLVRADVKNTNLSFRGGTPLVCYFCLSQTSPREKKVAKKPPLLPQRLALSYKKGKAQRRSLPPVGGLTYHRGGP